MNGAKRREQPWPAAGEGPVQNSPAFGPTMAGLEGKFRGPVPVFVIVSTASLTLPITTFPRSKGAELAWKIGNPDWPVKGTLWGGRPPKFRSTVALRVPVSTVGVKTTKNEQLDWAGRVAPQVLLLVEIAKSEAFVPPIPILPIVSVASP